MPQHMSAASCISSWYYFLEVKGKARLSPCLVGSQNPKSCYSTYHIECLWPMYGALNVDEKKN